MPLFECSEMQRLIIAEFFDEQARESFFDHISHSFSKGDLRGQPGDPARSGRGKDQIYC